MHKQISRRDFLKLTGLGVTAATASGVLAACSSRLPPQHP